MSNIVSVKLKRPEVQQDFISYASFETEPSEANRAIATDLDVLKQELDNLFSTYMYERPYQPEYYNPLEELIGELWTESSSTMAIHLVTEKINKFIPRIRLSEKTTFSFDNYTIHMSLVFSYTNDFNKTLYSYERDFNQVT